jgi:hypothetical protein
MSQRQQRRLYDKENIKSNAHLPDPIIGSVVAITKNTTKNIMSQSSDGSDWNHFIQEPSDGGSSYAAAASSAVNSPPLSPFGSIWDCPGIMLDTVDEIPGWRCKYCPRVSDIGGYRFFKYRNATKALAHLTQGADIAKCRGEIPPNVRTALQVFALRKAELSAEFIARKSATAQEIDDHQFRVLQSNHAR